ncbi:MAG: hypothetical protein JRD03_09120 [Deltaproteobacteria bacterium]|nr:hypothetical protein [Deltaproteobacteria bacterium]
MLDVDTAGVVAKVEFLRARFIIRGIALMTIFAVVGCLPSKQGRVSTAAVTRKGAPLAVQAESAYVTDRSRWGVLIFDPGQIRSSGGSAEDASALAALIEKYHRSWLSRDSDATQSLLDVEITRIRNGTAEFGIADVMDEMADESRGERPEGYAGSTELAIRNVRIRIDQNTATAFYRIDTHSGARWEYSDLITVFQAFRKTDGRWALFHHVESSRLDDENAPPLPDDEPNRRAPFVLDFVYPVKNLARAIAFYTPFLGEPEMVTADRASFRLRDSRFELEAVPFDDRITIKEGAGNGYGIINVRDLDASRKALVAAGAERIDAPRPCGPDLCMVAEDPSLNIVVWREPQFSVSSEPVRPTFSLGETASGASSTEMKEVFRAWMDTDRDAVLRHLATDAIWIDDTMAEHPLGVAVSRQAIGDALDARWEMFDRGPDGLAADMEITELQTRTFGDRQIVTFAVALKRRGAHPVLENTFVSQVWTQINGKNKIETSFITRQFKFFDKPVSSMDYTAYPLLDLGEAGRFYKDVLGSEPYRDVNWFGFWSTTSVFGMFEAPSKTTPFRPYPHRNNGYADLSIRSAEETLLLLRESGVELPHVPGINQRSGIDPNPGYRQILAVDTEGNLINFSEYNEY